MCGVCVCVVCVWCLYVVCVVCVCMFVVVCLQVTVCHSLCVEISRQPPVSVFFSSTLFKMGPLLLFAAEAETSAGSNVAEATP